MTIRQAVLDAANSTSVTEICQSTGYTSRQVSNVVYQLVALGKLRKEQRGSDVIYAPPAVKLTGNSIFNQG